MKKILAVVACICMVVVLSACVQLEHINGKFKLNNFEVIEIEENGYYANIDSSDFIYNNVSLIDGEFTLSYQLKTSVTLPFEKKVEIKAEVTEYGEFIIIKGTDKIKDIKIDKNKILLTLTIQVIDGVFAACTYILAS